MGFWFVFHFMYWLDVMHKLFSLKLKIQIFSPTMYTKSVSIDFIDYALGDGIRYMSHLNETIHIFIYIF